MFKVTVVEITPAGPDGPEKPTVTRLEVCVDVIDLKVVFAAVHQKPRKPRERKVKDAKADLLG